MTWEDRTPFEAITYQFGLSEQEVIALIQKAIKPSSFRMWREHVHGGATKHQKLREGTAKRFKYTDKNKFRAIRFQSVRQRFH